MKNEGMKTLVFNIGDIIFASDAMKVERILEATNITKIPESPCFVEGFMDYNGKALPIISLPKRFNMEMNSDNFQQKVIVLLNDICKVGILVDEVMAVMDTNKLDIEVPAKEVSGVSKRYIEGLFKYNDSHAILIDLDLILIDEEREELIKAKE
ncbi:MAG: chemotaxis protein CheW [Clostridiaceae bacterium]